MISKRSLKIFVTSAVLIVGILPFAAHAQDATATAEAGPCDSYSADASTVFQNVNQVLGGSPQVADLGGAGISIARLRLEYQETPVPAGCETTQTQLVQVMKLDEDAVFLDLGAETDTANKANYINFLTSTWQTRFNAFKDSISVTPEAVSETEEATSEDEAMTCTDTAFQQQIVSGMKGMSMTLGDIVPTGATGLSIIGLRYQIEDLVPPAGCEGAQADVVNYLSLTEDEALAVLAGLSDTANSATYVDFINKEIMPRLTSMGPQITSDLGMGGTPEATPAS